MSEISNNNEYIPRAERRNKDGLTEKEFLNNIIRDTMKDLVLRLICFFLA